MANLKTVRENLDDVQESLREYYVEKDNKFYLELEGIDDHPAVAGLRNALAEQKKARAKQAEEIKTLRERVSKIPDDFNPDELATLRAKIEEYEADPDRRSAPDQKAMQDLVAARKMLEQKIASMEKSHATEMDKLNKQIQKKDGFIHGLLIDDGLTKALVEVGVGKEFLKASKALLRENVKVVEEDGDYTAVVETDTGPLDIQRYVSDWVASDEGKPFVPPAKGGDAGGTSRPQKPIVNEKNPWAKDSWNLTEQGKLLRDDRPKAERLAKAAGHKIPAAA
jgi:hypothetical protein